MRWVLVHLPHLLPPVLAFGFLARLGLWAADQPPQQYSDEEVAVWRADRAAARAERRRPVQRTPALIGLVVLGPLVACVVTGLFIYTFNLRDHRPSSALILTHTALSIAALLAIAVKIALIGWRTIRARLSLRRAHDAWSSLVLGALGLPLVATGAYLLARPDGDSFADYLHLIASVWWTLILQWHLYRYLVAALRATSRSTPRTTS